MATITAEISTQMMITICIAIQNLGSFTTPKTSSVSAFRRKGHMMVDFHGKQRRRREMFGSIVVGTDGSETANYAVSQAKELASNLGSHVHLVAAYEPVPESRLRQERKEAPEGMGWMINPREDVEVTLEDAASQMRAAGVQVSTHPIEDDPADAILDVAEQQKAELIIVGNKGMRGARRFLLGNVPNKVSHHAPCNVLIIRTT